MRTALSPLEHYRNETHDCGWWLLTAEQTMSSPRLCHRKSRKPSQPFKCCFGTWARSCSCIPVGAPLAGAKRGSGRLRGPGFPWQLCNGERKGLLQKGKQEGLSVKNTAAVGCEITLPGRELQQRRSESGQSNAEGCGGVITHSDHF